MIRKAFLFVALFLVLTLATTAQVEAVAPPPTDTTRVVVFSGDISGSTELMERRARGGKHLDLIGVLGPEGVLLTFEDVLGWSGLQKGNLIISIDLKAEEVEMTYAFGLDEQCANTKRGEYCRDVLSYQLRGSGGTYDGVSVSFLDDAFTMYDVILVPPKGKHTSGYGLDFEWAADLLLTFDVSISH